MCVFIPDSSKPNPSFGIGTPLNEPVCGLDLALVDFILASLDINCHKLVRFFGYVDVWLHVLLEERVAPSGKFFITEFGDIHGDRLVSGQSYLRSSRAFITGFRTVEA